MFRERVQSSVIQAIGYDSKTRTLEIEFLSGNVYQYFEVPESLHEEFMQAPSFGEFFNERVKEQFEFTQV